MLQLIALILFIASALIMGLILLKKMPTLATMPKNGTAGIRVRKNKTWLKWEKRWKDFHFDFFKKQVWLHKLLAKSKILLLKAERNVDQHLHGIRKKAQELDKEVKKKK